MIDSNYHQFDFDLSTEYLKVDLFRDKRVNLASIERVNVYLNDGRLLKHVFIVAGKLFYYYEKGNFVAIANPHDLVLAPPKENICSRFQFTEDKIVLVQADNNPKPAKLGIGWWIRIDWLFGIRPNPLDAAKSIEQNETIEITNWNHLPPRSKDDLFILKDSQ